MSRYIRFTFIDEGVSANAILLEDQAPTTCQVIWDHLPIEGDGLHAIYSGSEIAFFIPGSIAIQPENITSRTIPGDVGYYALAPGALHGYPDGLTELCWFYDRDGRPHMPDGPVQINLFARFVGNTDAFYAICRRIRREGVKPVRVERVS